MRFSLFTLLDRPAGVDAGRVYAEAIEQAVRAEELGYDAFWLAEHHFTDYGVCPSPPVLGAAVAARTSRIRIGVAVAVLPLHDPRRIAEDYAMLDVLSGGRLDFGAGRGYSPPEFAALGVSMEEARDRFDEALAVVEGLWSNEAFSFDGRYYQVPELSLEPRPVQSPIPVWVAAASPDSFERAARAGRPFLSAPQITPLDKVRESYELYRRVLAEEGGDPARAVLPMQRPVYAAPTAEAAYEEPRDAYLAYVAKNTARMRGVEAAGESYRFYRRAEQHLAQIDYDALFEQGLLLFGEPDRLAASIRRLEDELGLTDLICWMGFGGLEHRLVLRSMEVFARDVVPLLARR